MAAVHVRDLKNLPLKDQKIKVSFYKIPVEVLRKDKSILMA